MTKLSHALGLILHPKKEWQKISQEKNDVTGLLFGYVMIMALIGPAAGYYGTTTNGWQIGDADAIRLTHESALTISILYYIAVVVSVMGLGFMVRWMCRTYGGNSTLEQGVALSTYVATPIFLVGIVEIFPILWLNLMIGLAGLTYSVYLLYSGVPIMMKISEDKGFLMSSALLAIGMVALVSLLAITALMWGFGFSPRFTD